MPKHPSIFASHGAPTFAVRPEQAGASLNLLGKRLLKPEAILVVSPHWMTSGVRVSTNPKPATDHDFGDFGPELRGLTYPAIGHPSLARRAAELLNEAGWTATESEGQDLDHGAWVPLLHLFPWADIPVFQVSMPYSLSAGSAWEMGSILSPLSKEGVLIIGSGSLTHNLRDFMRHPAPLPEYVHGFTDWITDAVVKGDKSRLIGALARAPHARAAHPTPEHFWPLLVAAGASGGHWKADVISGGIQHDVLAMDGFVFNEA